MFWISPKTLFQCDFIFLEKGQNTRKITVKVYGEGASYKFYGQFQHISLHCGRSGVHMHEPNS